MTLYETIHAMQSTPQNYELNLNGMPPIVVGGRQVRHKLNRLMHDTTND